MISGGRHPFIDLVNVPEACVPVSVSFYYLPTIIVRAIINYDTFPVCVRLRQQRIQRFGQRPAVIKAGNNDTYQRIEAEKSSQNTIIDVLSLVLNNF